VEFSLTSSLKNEAKIALFEALLHHMLYIRGQIAVPFRELVEALSRLQDDSAPTRGQRFALQSKVRKLDTFVTDVNDAIDGLHAVSSGSEIASLSLVLGASAAAPREMSTLYFNENTSSSGNVNTDVLKRRLIRELINYSPFDSSKLLPGDAGSSGNKALPATSIFLSVMLREYEGVAVSGMGAHSSLYGRRDGYHPLLRRKSAAPLAVHVTSAEAGAQNDDGDGGGGGAEEGIVFVLKRGVRPLRKNVTSVLLFDS